MDHAQKLGTIQKSRSLLKAIVRIKPAIKDAEMAKEVNNLLKICIS